MKEHTQHVLIERVLEHIENGTTDCAAAERTVPTDDYLGDERLRREMASVFQRRPVLLAHSSQLAKPGDFVTEDVYGRSVLAVRTRRGEVRAFLNVCRHRGARLVDAEQGTAARGFSCRTHAWRYDDEGTLAHVPDQARCFSPSALAERNLFQVPAQERHGFVWVGPPQAGAEAPTRHLDALDEDFSGYRFGDDTFWAGETLTGRFNWKLGVEGFLEVYHFRSLHPDMKKYVFVPEVALFDQLGEHVRIVAPKRDIRELRSTPAAARRLRPHATLVYHVFPSTFFFVEKRHVTTLRIQPLSADSSEIRVLHVARQDGLVRPDTLRTNISLFTKVLGEDVGAAESVQGGLAAAPQELLFGRNEAGLHYFRDTLLRAMEPAEHLPA
ncbi:MULTISPECIES: aromatic ring-hydroxylating dioxygenase subunit alpha [unclassified Streptomyces]|uniref:aromatic ring-hydroxylating oxygenase subunit alpha n=1 Tax=unclassified Streptomyces TaxID=2593676 RepID=UPI0035DAF201